MQVICNGGHLLQKTKTKIILVFLLLSVFLYSSCVTFNKKTEVAYSYLADSMDFYCTIPVQSDMSIVDFLVDYFSNKIDAKIAIKSYVHKVYLGGNFVSQNADQKFQSVLLSSIPDFIFSRIFSAKNGWKQYTNQSSHFFENNDGLQVQNRKGIGVFVSNGIIEYMNQSENTSKLLDEFFLSSVNSLSFMICNPETFFSTFFNRIANFPISTVTGFLVDNSFDNDGELETVACSLKIMVKNQNYAKALMSFFRLLLGNNFSSITNEEGSIVISDIIITLKTIENFLQNNFNF